ncbi:MAG: hypothetical protein M3355_04695 [Actinomycetota bacterium]|nr:hypothetical protein [Actinomycetota bacterium]
MAIVGRPCPAAAPPRQLGLGLPVRRDRRQQRGIAQQCVDALKILGQVAHLQRQHLVPQRLHLSVLKP